MEPDLKHLSNASKRPARSFLGSIFVVLTGSALLILGFMFSLLILCLIAVAGLAGYGYLWWKTRALREQIRQRQTEYSGHSPTPDENTDGIIIEGEVIHDADKSSRK